MPRPPFMIEPAPELPLRAEEAVPPTQAEDLDLFCA